MKKDRKFLRKMINRDSRTSMFGISTLLVLTMAILLYLRNGYQQDQIQYSYCGDFGFYGKSLTLMKDSTFRFRYYGCSQTNGYVRGTWQANEEILILLPYQPDEHLDFEYRIADNLLLPVNRPDEMGFVSCNDYFDAWQREAEDYNYLRA